MKIPESIILKYQLSPSGEQCGESFMQNLLLFKSDTQEFKDCLFMECDLMGNPCRGITIYNKKTKRYAFYVTPEFLADMDFESILNLLR